MVHQPGTHIGIVDEHGLAFLNVHTTRNAEVGIEETGIDAGHNVTALAALADYVLALGFGARSSAMEVSTVTFGLVRSTSRTWMFSRKLVNA